jgi:hypothetical protein
MNNKSAVNWKNIIDLISSRHGDIRTIGIDFYKNSDGRFDHILELWNQAGYTKNKVEWINYYPEKHFDTDVADLFSREVGMKHIRSWISCIRPGKSAPWHQDIDDDIEHYLKLGKLKRYTCFIDKPNYGQVTVIDKQAFYMIPENTIFEWNDILDWHGASNCGFHNYYLYHYLGFEG